MNVICFIIGVIVGSAFGMLIAGLLAATDKDIEL